MFKAKRAGRYGELMKILAIGGTGLVGSAVVRELLLRKADVRMSIRDENVAVPEGCEIAIGDLLNPSSVEKALEGIDKLYLLNAVTPDELTQRLIAYDLAKRHEIRHVVYRSVFRAEAFKDVPHFASKIAIESALRAFGVPWTVIRPNYFFKHDIRLRDSLTNAGVSPVPLGPVGVFAVDVRDIAEATAIALTSDGHEDATYNITGPDTLCRAKAADIWSDVLDRNIRYPGHNMHAFEIGMAQHALAWSAFDIRMMFEGYLERGFAAEPDDVAKLTALLGHAPRTYKAFARETAASWRPTHESRREML